MKYLFHLPDPIPAARPVVLNTHTFNPKSIDLRDNVQKIKVQCFNNQEYRHLLTTPIKQACIVRVKYSYIRSRTNKKEFHTQKPDVDNLVKFTLDVLTRSILVDDAYVIEIHAEKVFAEERSVTIEIELVESKRAKQQKNTAKS